MIFAISLNSLSYHSTIKITLGDEEHYTDLYYYCLDNTYFEDENSLTKGLLNFVSMVENWKLKIKNLTIGPSTILPFDYSDQYIGFFIVSKINENEVEIEYTATIEYQGPLINPSQLYFESLIDKPFELLYKKYTMSIYDLLRGIEDSMTTIFSSFYKRNF